MNDSFNSIKLTGTVAAAPVYDHTLLGEAFYKLIVSTKRLSGAADELPITVSERLLGSPDEHPAEESSRVSVSGQIRTYNQHDDSGSHLIITVFAKDIEFPEDGEERRDENEVELIGRICKPVIYRTTPFEREISDILLAVNRRYGKGDYLPCIAWGRNARYSNELSVNDLLLIRGRLQSRIYQKALPDGSVEQRTAYEVSIFSFEKLDY